MRFAAKTKLTITSLMFSQPVALSRSSDLDLQLFFGSLVATEQVPLVKKCPRKSGRPCHRSMIVQILRKLRAMQILCDNRKRSASTMRKLYGGAICDIAKE